MGRLKQFFCYHSAETGRVIAEPTHSLIMPTPEAVLWRCDECGRFEIRDARKKY